MKTIQRKAYKVLFVTFLMIFLNNSLSAQEYSVEMFPNRYRLSWETVSMDTESDLGFIGLGFDVFNLIGNSSNVYFGISSYSAMSGIRPGLITLGISGGWRKELLKNSLYLDLGGFVGGGGGGGAADGGGLIVRPHIALEKRFDNLGVFVGYSQINFPTGAIKGSQFNLGITINGGNYLKVAPTDFENITSSQIKSNSLRVALVGTQYYNFKAGSLPERPEVEPGKVGLLGVQIERSFSSNFYGILKANGAITGGADGYMSILFGAGGKLPIIEEKVNLESRLLFGPTGGGAVDSGGGATAQAEVGAALLLGKGYDVKFMIGKTIAPWGGLNTNHIEFGIGKSFDVIALKKHPKEIEQFNVNTSDYWVNHMAISVFNRTYFPPEANDLNGEPYQSAFNLIGFEIEKYLGERFSINGGTVWAYEGGYGAYAEGLLGMTYYQPIFNTWKLSVKGMVGAAGGGALNLGEGLLFEYSLGVHKELNKKWDIAVNFGKTEPLSGNFTPYMVDVGVKFHINQLIKKK